MFSLLSSGCYLTHLAHGQAKILLAREPIESLIEDPETSPELRDKLEHVLHVRAFAERLGLEVDGQYTSYVSWPGDRIVTIVSAAEPNTVTPISFRFPIVGNVPYKGFFDERRATDEATRLSQKGYDTCLSPVSAYSTLGWIEDPITSPMLNDDLISLTETILHELVHATVYVAGQSDFNEGIANFIGQEAGVLFFEEQLGAEAAESQRARQRVRDRRKISQAKMEFRKEIEALYAQPVSEHEKGEQRSNREEGLREKLRALSLEVIDPQKMADRARLNDACLALVGTYHEDIPSYARIHERLGNDLPAFIEAAREAADSPDPRASIGAASTDLDSSAL